MSSGSSVDSKAKPVPLDSASDYVGELAVKFSGVDFYKPLLTNDKVIVAGGCFKDMFLERPARDVDVFFRTEKAYQEYVDKFENSPAFTLQLDSGRSKSFKRIGQDVVVDLIYHQFGAPLDILQYFDFTVCKFAYYMMDGEYYVLYHSQYFRHLKDRELHLTVHPSDVDQEFNRVIKYARYGFDLSVQSKARFFENIVQSRMPVTVTSSASTYSLS
jgi:hypothetical protein